MLTCERVGEIAQGVGLPVVGCAPATAMMDVLPVLDLYYAQGRASGFEHPVAGQRVDPASLLPGARTVIAAALPYHTKDASAMRRPPGQRGQTSVYIWGEDYHRVLGDKLRALAHALEMEVGVSIRSVVCVDTSPLLDRALAVRAGIGWIGKNTCLITESYGSWVFLGALITDLEVQDCSAFVSPTSEHSVAPVWLDECGDCELCLTACPTGALREAYILDSHACLSYLTQAKGVFPETYRTALGKRLWGCDTCQTVCPKNKTSLQSVEDRFMTTSDLAFPKLCEVLTMSSRAIMRRYGHTAGAWRGATVWKRNALIALGNMRDRAAVVYILPFLCDPRPELRGSAAWALGRIDPTGSRDAVKAAFTVEQDEQARSEMHWSTATAEAVSTCARVE